ncbi:MAG: PhoH family protein [Phycisphaerales bacterium]|nr:PhoH family protein [Phycisphaerales bacterium]
MADKDKSSTTDPKCFVLDTNVLLHNPNALFAFDDNQVVIPFTVIEELDRFKTENNDIGRNARQCIRHLDRLRVRGDLTQGAKWSNGGNGHDGTIRIDLGAHDVPDALRTETADNRIIAVAWQLKQAGRRTVFISKDLNARIKSDALGIRTEDFEAQKVDADRLYSGYAETTLPGNVIDELYSERMLPLEKLAPYLIRQEADGSETPLDLQPNQFLVMHDDQDDSHGGLARRLADTEHCIPITGPRRPVFGILPRNSQQIMAIDLLLDDEVKLVTLLGMAGTGKTLIAIAAGMLKTLNEERYDKLLVARPIMPMGRDIGYLPGDKDEKLAAWMQPIFDNLAYLLSTRGSSFQTAESHTPEQRIQKLLLDGKLVLEPLTYIRGRSIPHQFMIVDEAQNLTPHEVKTIASRVGEGTKLVLTGDIAQIDNPYLDQSSNGLSYLVEHMKGEAIIGHVTLAKTERSELASLAAERL